VGKLEPRAEECHFVGVDDEANTEVTLYFVIASHLQSPLQLLYIVAVLFPLTGLGDNIVFSQGDINTAPDAGMSHNSGSVLGLGGSDRTFLDD
jgi:hypothetical protein